jgi:hypothetical protein
MFEAVRQKANPLTVESQAIAQRIRRATSAKRNRALVEHFFRHEFDGLVALLTRWLGVRRTSDLREVRNGCTMGTQAKR